MGATSIFHWLIVLVLVGAIYVLPMVAIAKVLRRAGFSSWLALIYIVPIVNIVGLFVFANARWPRLER